MIAIRLVSLLHLLWGLTFLIHGSIPDPFRPLDPLSVAFDYTTICWILIVTAILAVSKELKWFRNNSIFAAFATLPQELILMSGAFWALIHYFMSWEIMMLVSFEFQLVLAIFHGLAMSGFYRRFILEYIYE